MSIINYSTVAIECQDYCCREMEKDKLNRTICRFYKDVILL